MPLEHGGAKHLFSLQPNWSLLDAKNFVINKNITIKM